MPPGKSLTTDGAALLAALETGRAAVHAAFGALQRSRSLELGEQLLAGSTWQAGLPDRDHTVLALGRPHLAVLALSGHRGSRPAVP